MVQHIPPGVLCSSSYTLHSRNNITETLVQSKVHLLNTSNLVRSHNKEEHKGSILKCNKNVGFRQTEILFIYLHLYPIFLPSWGLRQHACVCRWTVIQALTRPSKLKQGSNLMCLLDHTMGRFPAFIYYFSSRTSKVNSLLCFIVHDMEWVTGSFCHFPSISRFLLVHEICKKGSCPKCCLQHTEELWVMLSNQKNWWFGVNSLESKHSRKASYMSLQTERNN